ncbi:MAG: hypothetical protein WBV94_02375 [Blastocatellia bacterium]
MENDKPPEVSPELEQLAKEYNVLLPQTEDWKRLSEDLGYPINAHHWLTVHWLLGPSFGKLFETFGIEVISYIPDFHVLDYFIDNQFDKLTEAEQMVRIESWVRRMRIYYLYNRVTTWRVSIISPFTSRAWTATPFIEAIWEQRRMTDISMYGFASAQQDQRAKFARHLSIGMELLRNDIKKRDLLGAVVKSFSNLPKRRGRPARTGYFEDTDTFLKALQEVLADFDTKPSRPQVLLKLSQHSLWQGKEFTIVDCRKKVKTLKNWLDKCKLSWKQALASYYHPPKKGK